jgi:D-alanine transaminase
LQNLAWVDGVFLDINEAKVSLEDRGYLFGDGVYEVARIYNGRPFKLGLHLERLQRSAAAIRIPVPYTIAEIDKMVSALIDKSSCTDGYIYIQLTRGSAQRDHLFPADIRPSMVMYVRESKVLPALEDVKPVRCITLPDERWFNCHIKSVNLLPNLLARQQAAEAGAQEAILYRPGDLVTEGTRSNVFALIDGIVRTHPQSKLILSGITRGIVLDIMAEQGVAFAEEAFTLQELSKASEVWITSSMMEVNPVGVIDEKPLKGAAPGDITRCLMEKFRAKVTEECY